MNTKKRKEENESKLIDAEYKFETVKAKVAFIEPERKIQEDMVKKTKSTQVDPIINSIIKVLMARTKLIK